jgi:hypothetical protein
MFDLMAQEVPAVDEALQAGLQNVGRCPLDAIVANSGGVPSVLATGYLRF